MTAVRPRRRPCFGLMSWTGKDAGTGADAAWRSAGFFRLKCGKIAEIWIVADTLGRLMTSGDVTAEPGLAVPPIRA